MNGGGAWTAALAIVLAGVGASSARAAHDVPYYKLDYRKLDDTYEARDARALRYAFFYWDGKPYCRYRSGWNGPGAYEVGTRLRPGHGWDGGYPWQGPGRPRGRRGLRPGPGRLRAGIPRRRRLRSALPPPYPPPPRAGSAAQGLSAVRRRARVTAGRRGSRGVEAAASARGRAVDLNPPP